MVFESIVTELLNKVLGEYIENLDYSQLKLSLWGGDVVLKDLLIKESALDMLDLPIKLDYGRLGKLVLKIPFKDMWNGQIDAIIEELFVLVVPSSQVTYDEEKEKKAQLEAKRAEIARVEKSKQLDDMKNQEKVDDSMMEKLIARMIKNIHVEIKRIHVRYEDRVTFKEHPFSVGFTLNSFALESCDNNWSTTGNLKDMYAIQQIFKLCTMDGLALYLNPSPKLFSTEPQSEYLKIFSESIATASFVPVDYQYLLGPINVNAKLKLNPKPETDGSNYTIPKVFLDLEMQKLRIGLTKRQYQTLMQMGEGLEQARNAAPYRKYRPNLTSYRGHYKEWWHFAYTCILEEQVRRARRNWDWNHMKKHRTSCKEYAKVYQKKLTCKRPTAEIEQQLTEHEYTLDIFNLIIIRQQIEMEVEKLAEKEKELRAKRGWFGWVWGSPQQEETQELNTAAAIMKKFEEAMTADEKAKLYRAIDYQENTAPTHYPETYEMIDMKFFLHGLQVLLSDTDKSDPEVLDLQFNGVQTGFKSRPSANAILVTASISDVKLIGVKQNDQMPLLISSENGIGSEKELFFGSFETNPLDKLCGQRVIVKSNSAHVVYDAQTIIELIKMFKVQNPSTLTQLQEAAAAKLDSFKEASALGLEYAIQKHAALDIQVDLEAPQLIVPYGGFYTGNESLLVINLGSLKMRSLEKPKETDDHLSVKQLVSMGKTEEDILAHLRQHSYDKFILKIINVQALISLANEDWRDALTNTISPIKILQPTTLEVQFHKCLITDDPLLPKTRLIGQLPSVTINITETRLLEGLAIAQSIPMPEEEPSELARMSLSKSGSQMSLFKELTSIPSLMEKKQDEKPKSPMKQTTDLEAKFVMKEFILTISKQEIDAVTSPFFRFELLQLEAELMQKTYTQEVMLRLGGVQVKQHHKVEEIFMINTPMSSGSEDYLIVIRFINMDKRSPDFMRQGSVVNLLQLEFTTLDVILHQECLINVLQFLSNIQDNITSVTATIKEKKKEQRVDRVAHLSTIQEDTSVFIKEHIQKQRVIKNSRKKVHVEITDLQVTAKIDRISLKMMNELRDISAFYIKGIAAGYTMKASHSKANVHLTSISIKDLNVKSIYRNIISVEGSESLQIEAIMNNITPDDIDKNNMSITVTMGCHRVVFLNAFVTSVMNFLNNFQAAQQAIAEASAAAAEAAKTNIKDVHQRATRIELSVNLKAPVVYVPMNSTSEHCLMLDMGNLTVSNDLKRIKTDTPSGEYPILDEMNVELQNLKLSRVRVNKENFAAENEVVLLQPVSVMLQIKRNLSAAWFRDIPDIEMSGRMKCINVLLNHEDYTTIMATLNENLGESVEDGTVAQAVVPAGKKSIAEESGKTIYVEVVKETSHFDLQETHQAQTTIKFEFIMDSLVIELFTGGSRMLKTQNSPLHLPQNSLAKFGLTYLAVKGRMYADGLLATSILLMNCTLDDTRPNRQGSLVRIMERTTEVPKFESLAEQDAKPVRSMLDVTVKKEANDMFVDVRVFSFSTIISLDYLMKIKAFFDTGPQASMQASQKAQAESALKKRAVQPAPPPPQDMTMTINLLIEKPDIILLEDMDDIDSKCIILNTELTLKLRMTGEHQVISGSIKDLSILTGIYNPLKRTDSIYQVLRPTRINIAGSTPEGKGLHIDVISTDIHISVSPGVIDILNRVLQTVIKKEEEGDEVKKLEPNHEGLWIIKSFKETDYWFLKTEMGTEAQEGLEFSDDEENSVAAYKPELAIVSAPTILLTLEAGVGNKTLPMLLLHLGFQSKVNDWSTNTMYIDSVISVVMAYYNSRLALWEPLIEPMEAIENGKRISTPWELKTKIQFNDTSVDTAVTALGSTVVDSDLDELQQKSRMSIEVLSSENLEVTVTKTCLDVLKQLGNAFSNAMEVENKTSMKTVAPYILKNETGLAMTLDLENSHFKIAEDEAGKPVSNNQTYSEVILESGASVMLASKVKVEIHLLNELKADTVKDREANKFVISFKDIGGKLEIPILRADKRFFSLKYRKEGSEEWGIISDVVVEDGSTIVTLRSVLQVHNHFCEPVSVYYMTKRGNEVEKVGTVQPDEKLNLPLDAVYTPTNIYWLFFSIDGYMVSIEPFIWKDLQKTVSMTKLLKCETRTKMETIEPFYIQTLYAVLVVASILFNSETLGMLLSIAERRFAGRLLSRLALGYWRAQNADATTTTTTNSAQPTTSTTIAKQPGLPIQAVGEIEQVYFENTSRHTMASTIYNVHLYPSIYLKNFLPIDIIICLPGNTQEKRVEASTTLQISTIDPNRSSFVIKLSQYLEKDWSCKVELTEDPPEFSVWSFESFDSAQKVIMDLGMHTSYKHGSIIMALYCPFWMLNKTGLMLSYRKSSKGGKEHSSPIKYGGINVDVQINEGGVYISLSAYTHGNAPALIINHTQYSMNLWEKGSMNVRTVHSYHRMFYTWENPAGPRLLVWEDGAKKEIADMLRKDVLGVFKLPDYDVELYYVSFLDGIQRVLLFTTSLKIAEDCQLVGDLEIIDQDITLSIHGIGLSLVNNINRSELLYICIASSGIIWETRKLSAGRWRALSNREVCLIEAGYQKYLRELQVDKETPYRVALEPKFEIDYLNMEILRPHRRYLRRTFQTGLWMQYQTSVHQVQLHAKINRLQIDNQLSDCVFPVILAPIPPPKSVTQDAVMKPFAEMSIVKRLLEHSNVQQFRYFKVLIQEFHVKVDLTFMNAVMLLFEADEANDAQESELFKTDMKLVDEPLLHHVNLITTAEQKNFFDLLHFSPLKIHISFSMTGSGGSGPSAVPQVLNVLLQGIGVTITDINDIVFKLAYFERDYVFMTNNQLISEATSHYTGQAIKQLYVLVLGLDVIGNPYGLVMGAMEGVGDLFYEPFQGAIQGPGEFAEGLMLGVRSMVGHTVGGMAGAVSKITGAMGKGLATLTFDKDYQRKRQEQLNKQPENLQEGLARSGKNLISGVVDGVSGVISKPISGAKEEGVEGFFKGFGKGVVGLVTRPTAGIVDFASGSFGAVRRATELNEEAKRVRPPRFLQPDSLVRPYVQDEAEGNKILSELEKGKYANTDIYYFHLYIHKSVLLLTDKRIAYLERCDLFGGWKVEWSYTWQEIDPPPLMVDKGVQICIRDSQRRRKFGGFFSSSDSMKILFIPDLATKQLLCSKIKEQLRQYDI
ncbi:vacuolar protein sorting-associated protein 13 [Copidosoma floridanum]|uniref:vacuolar protein sorting-associated protein 13 n=1 Tax=Copidosoma floridanum TaxID=29053 RepID=UPI000C6F566F|nr:vacuolar protein sorting-associated protein 13 [Copidosoma floridanum]